MKSPFPGMDPFLEACGLWEGFHNRLIHKIDETLAQILPRSYTIDIATWNYVVIVDAEGKREHLTKPDVTINAELPEDAESVQMQAFIAEEFEETFVEIYAELDERVLVTCIEVLSPTNKRPGTEGWVQYERKRQALLLGRANFIELDLLRGGQKPPMLTPWPASPYTLLVSRATTAPYCRVWLGQFLRPLPVIPVPLLAPEPDLRLDLQPLLDDIYALGRYDERIDYARPLVPTLAHADVEAVRQLLKDRSSQSATKGRNPS